MIGFLAIKIGLMYSKVSERHIIELIPTHGTYTRVIIHILNFRKVEN